MLYEELLGTYYAGVVAEQHKRMNQLEAGAAKPSESNQSTAASLLALFCIMV